MSLYSDLTEVLTPYANKIKELNGSLENIPIWSDTAIGLLKDILYAGYYSDGTVKSKVDTLIAELTGEDIPQDDFTPFNNFALGTIRSVGLETITISTPNNRISTNTYLELNAGEIVGFDDSSYYDDYTYAISRRISSNSVDWNASGASGGYITADFTATVDSEMYYIQFKRVDDGNPTTTDIDLINSHFGKKTGAGL